MCSLSNPEAKHMSGCRMCTFRVRSVVCACNYRVCVRQACVPLCVSNHRVCLWLVCVFVLCDFRER